MVDPSLPNLYEDLALRAVTGDAIRPGGFLLTEQALALSKFDEGANILDVGCGTGVTVEHLRKHHQLNAIGVDPSQLLLEQGRERFSELPVWHGSGESLPFSDETMDGIFAECTLSLMDAEKALCEFLRVLKRGGRLVVTDVYARNSDGVNGLRQLGFTSCLTGAMHREELLNRLHSHGFTLELWEDHSRLLGELTARLIFAGMSPTAFWGSTCSGNCVGMGQAIDGARPGYFLLIANKPR